MNATDILGQLLGAGTKGSGSLNTGTGAKALEELLGVGGSGQNSGQQGGGVFGGGQSTGGTTAGGSTGGGIGQQNTGTSSGGGLGDLLGKALKELGRGGGGQTSGQTSGNNPFEQQTSQNRSQANSNEHAAVYLRAMIQAGLADGRIDEQEQQLIMKKVGNLGAEEQNFIRAEIAKGSDVAGFIQSVPRGIEEQVYAASLMAIQLDNKTEAQFLDAVAKGLRITQQQSNAIHDRLGTQRLYG